MTEKEMIRKLTGIARAIARGNYSRASELFELTRGEDYSPAVADLAESFGSMLVQIEAREFRLEEMITELRRVRDELSRAKNKLAEENIMLRQVAKKNFLPNRILGNSLPMQDLMRRIERIADTPVNVLIYGETGTGKELVAKSLHFASRRADKPFVAINCTAIPESLFESEMFGVEKGVATGVERRIGRLEQANGGTLFLDEIGDMSLSAQAKMLRVLEEREIERVGGRSPVKVDIRVVAATHRDLKQLVQEERFREDLYFRLNVVGIKIPPLRERPDDIPFLLNHYLDRYSSGMGRSRLRFSPEAATFLRHYPWPGNVRELENEVERAVALTCSDTILPDDLSEAVRCEPGSNAPQLRAGTAIRQSEEQLIRLTLANTGNNKSETARILGITREGLRKKMIRFHIEP